MARLARTTKCVIVGVCVLWWTAHGATSSARAQPAAVAGFSADFYRLCDLACKELNSPTRKVAFYNDSYAVRALAVGHDLTKKREYLDTCKAWSDRMIVFQEQMIPAGAYYMNYGRKPGAETGHWYVADNSSIALGVLATAVRCEEPAKKERYLRSAKSFAKLVIDNYLGPNGGIRNGLWPAYDGQWWCSSGIFGSLMFQLHAETGEKRYLEVGLGALDWLNRLDLDKAGPMTFKEMGPTMPMYVLETYSAAWPYIESGSERRKAAGAQMTKALEWMAKNQAGRGNPSPLDYNSQWGSKMGGLPFHMLVYARHAAGNDPLTTAAEQELRHIVRVLDECTATGLPQLTVFSMMSLAERVSPGAMYRKSQKTGAGDRPAFPKKPTATRVGELRMNRSGQVRRVLLVFALDMVQPPVLEELEQVVACERAKPPPSSSGIGRYDPHDRNLRVQASRTNGSTS